MMGIPQAEMRVRCSNSWMIFLQDHHSEDVVRQWRMYLSSQYYHFLWTAAHLDSSQKLFSLSFLAPANTQTGTINQSVRTRRV